MSKKFGAPPEFWKNILLKCKELEMKTIGVSFHVGSGGCSITSYQESLKNARDIFMMAKDIGLGEMTLLDIGGGFSCSAEKPENDFEIIGPQLNQAIKDIFPSTDIKVIGEPGRFICQDAVSVCTRVTLARQQKNVRHYFVNTGVYQAFACQVFDGEFFKGQPLL